MELYFLIIINTIIFFIGYILGKFSLKNHNINIPKNYLNNKINNNYDTNISIDEKKIVTKIDTSDLEKKYKELGQVKTITNDISGSIDKLKKLKK